MDIVFEVEVGDIVAFQADVIALKFSQNLYGADRVVAGILGKGLREMRRLLPELGSHKLIPGPREMGATSVLFISVPALYHFRYEEIREFAAAVLKVLAEDAPTVRHLAMTIHGVGYGLDEAESLRSQLAGCMDALEAGQYPSLLERISIVEQSPGRAQQLMQVLDEAVPGHVVTIPSLGSSIDRSALVTDVGRESASKPHAVVVMPSSDELDDYYYFGIKFPVNEAGYLCERAKPPKVDIGGGSVGEPGLKKPEVKSTYLAELHRLISKSFDEGELRTLCFDLAVDYDSLRGEGKESKSRELVLYLSRRARVVELIDSARERRPKASWPELFQDVSPKQLLLEQFKSQVDTASFLIAELTDLDPNTLLLVGYAWGKGQPTILLVREGKALPFDLQGQRCLVYNRIRDLNEMLAKELLQAEDKTTIV